MCVALLATSVSVDLAVAPVELNENLSLLIRLENNLHEISFCLLEYPDLVGDQFCQLSSTDRSYWRFCSSRRIARPLSRGIKTGKSHDALWSRRSSRFHFLLGPGIVSTGFPGRDGCVRQILRLAGGNFVPFPGIFHLPNWLSNGCAMRNQRLLSTLVGRVRN